MATRLSPDDVEGIRRLPRWLVWIGVPIACVGLILFFILLSLPYERFKPTLEQEFSRAIGGRVTLREFGIGWAGLGPGMVASGVIATLDDGTVLEFDSIRVRPAFSTRWLSREPALAIQLESPMGKAHGTLQLGSVPGWDGRFEEVDLSAIPVTHFSENASLGGSGNISADLKFLATGPEGAVNFEATEGWFSAPGTPVDIPYDRVVGVLALGTETAQVEVLSLVLEGPLIAGHARGQVGRSRVPAQAPLDFTVELEPVDKNLRPVLRSAGLPLRGDGSGKVRIEGTLGRPRVTSANGHPPAD